LLMVRISPHDPIMSVLFRRLAESAPRVAVTFDGREVRLPEGENLAAALLVEGLIDFGAGPRQGAARGPFCLMGSCFQCVVAIDGEPGQRACRAVVRAGMRIARSVDA